MATTVQSAKGPGLETVALPVCSLPMAFNYNGNDLTQAIVVYNGVTYIQSFTYVNGNLTSVTAWEPQ